MKDLYAMYNSCLQELNAIGIYPNKVETVSVNKRKSTTWGTASRTNGVYSIKINVVLVDDRISDTGLRATMFHELLHCVDGCMNHGEKWTRYAELVSDCYGVNVKRTNSTDEKARNSQEAELIREISRDIYHKKTFAIKCSFCGIKTSRETTRTPKWYMHTEQYRCTRCGGKLVKC